MTESPYGTDGAIDRVLKFGSKACQVPAIFIHAGAGFHSHQNERVHLEACIAAAEMGMKFLKASGSATEAVEAALRVLEDKEITNAGYGSNLSIDGTVECDATIVDHLGRSGACGSVPNIRNPISLAKLILDTSNQPLSLRRVPPNALVGDGARDFAREHGMAIFANEHLVSRNARDRFLRWQEDLRRAEIKHVERRAVSSPEATQTLENAIKREASSSPENISPFSRDHAAAIASGTWNEGQPDSPAHQTSNSDSPAATERSSIPVYFKNIGASRATVHRSSVRATAGRLDRSVSPSRNPRPGRSPSNHKVVPGDQPGSIDRTRRARDILHQSSEHTDDGGAGSRDGPAFLTHTPGSSGEQHEELGESVPHIARRKKRLREAADEHAALGELRSTRPFQPGPGPDVITDTIGAIAIDSMGHIAAGSSSGGIGMKHRGRLGPAALVGIGTAVVPCAEDDEDGVAVAAVTSGTGEHMATTMASQRCAERIYKGTRYGPRNTDAEEDDEDAIMESFIVDDFMNHPGVRNYHSAGAIGVMVVKKSRAGYYFYFAHNTDSFALASMGGNEKEARCVMSRLSKGAKIARGGRKVRTT